MLFSFLYIFHILIDLFYIKSHFHFFDFLLINHNFFLIQHYLNLNYCKQYKLIKNKVKLYYKLIYI